jgi:methionyl-tRNA synthetase
MAGRYCQGQVPAIDPAQLAADNPLKSKGQMLAETVAIAYEALAFNQACEGILGLVRASNKFLDDKAPWTLYKQGHQAETEAVLYSVLESVRLAAYLISPVVPGLANAIYQQLGLSADFNHTEIGQQLPYADHSQWGYLPAGQPLGEAQPIFQRIELPAPSA